MGYRRSFVIRNLLLIEIGGLGHILNSNLLFCGKSVLMAGFGTPLYSRLVLCTPGVSGWFFGTSLIILSILGHPVVLSYV